ncbi:MAG: universal stress protein [Kribbellaceae bacterium]
MTDRILVAVDDSPAGLAAARTAVGLATRLGAELRFLNVVSNGAVTSALGGPGNAQVAERRQLAAAALLHHVAAMARDAGAVADTRRIEGEPARGVLDEARAWQATLVVIGRSGRRGAGEPYMGRETRHVLEFAEQPVLVVPW